MPVFLQGRRAFLSSLRRRHRRGQPLSSPPFHRFGPCLPAPRLFVPRLPRCGHLSLLPSPRLLRCRSLPLLPSPRLPRCRHLSLLPSPRLPRCRLSLLPSPRLPRCRRLRIPKRRTARTSPARSEQPHDPRPFSHPAQGSATARVPFAVLPGAPVPAPEAQKKADGTAQRPVRRQKATNLSRQHHRGSSSTRQVSALA